MTYHRYLLLVFVVLAGLVNQGCSGQPPAVAPPVVEPKKDDIPKVVVVDPGEVPGLKPIPVQVPDVTNQDKYDAALAGALGLLAERKLPEALASLEAAKSFQNTEFIRGEIDKLRTRLEQQAAADRTVQDIQTVLEQGNPAKATELATTALKEYGGTESAPQLLKLKLQADALAAAPLADNAAKQRHFRDEADAALKDQNKRAAALALEQALAFGDDATLRQTYDQVRADLTKYDDNRARAAELRRDPARLEEALDLLREAEKAWPTLPLRQDIDEYTLALQNRRDRVSVAEFEVRGEVGLAFAGRTVAEELLPLLKPRYDLVERDQLAKIADDLKLQAGQLGEADAQRELGRVAKVRFLVLGSVSRLGGITVNARLVDMQSGLVVQAAKVTAPTPEDVVAQLPELAKLLLMKDEERALYEAQKASQPKVEVVQVNAPLPPAPVAPVADAPPPPPLVLENSPPPPLGALQAADFDRLPLPPPQPTIVVLPPGGERELRWRHALLQISLELGDNLFRRGRFREALRHYEFALNLAPGNFDVMLRLDRCRPFVPPLPPVVVLAPPRLAIVDFAVLGEPIVVPPYLGRWTPQYLAPYFAPSFEVVDRGEMYWYMGRMGLSVQDLMLDPYARLWLGRALNVRYFLFGSLRQTASFDATTHLVDAESGYLTGAGRIHVRTPLELKLRLGELARLTLMNQVERQRYLQEDQRIATLLVQAETERGRGKFDLASNLLRDALKIRVGNVQILVQLNDINERARREALENSRRREQERMQLEAAAFHRRQVELARAAEFARIQAAQQQAAFNEAERQRWLDERRRQQDIAQAGLLAQARIAIKGKNFAIGLQLFDSAQGIRPNEAGYKEMALARADADRAGAARAEAERQARELAMQRQREAELARARQQLEEDQRRRALEEEARRKAQEKADQVAFQNLFDEGQRQLNKENYDAAINALQSARRLRNSPEVETLLNQAFIGQARAQATAKGDAARQALERQLADEKARRIAAEAEAKRNQDLYTAALLLAQKALADKNYDLAAAKYEEAGKFYKTDLVLTGLRQAQNARAQTLAATAAAKQKAEEEQRNAGRFQKFMTDGRAALDARDYGRAAQNFAEAKKINPSDIEVLTGLTKAEQLRDQAAQDQRRKSEEQERLTTFKRLLEAGQANLANKKFDAAVLTLTEALKLDPTNARALQLKGEAEKARQQSGADVAEAKKRADLYQKAMSDGRYALQSKQYDAAIKAFGEAQKLLPDDRSSADFLKDAQKAKTDAQTVLAAEAKKRADEVQRSAELKRALDQARAGLAAKDLKTASAAVAVAVKLDPRNPEVQKLNQDLVSARQAEEAGILARKQRLEQQQTLIQTGKAALAASKFDDAVRAFTEAGALVPDNTAARDLLQQALKARDDAKGTTDAALKAKLAEQQKAEKLKDLLTTVRDAFKDKQLRLAEKALGDAVRLAPEHPEVKAAQTQLQQLQKEADTETAKAKTLADYRDAIAQGQKALADKKYDAAINAFTAATKLVPGDPAATKLIQQAEQARRDANTAGLEAKVKAARVQQLLQDAQVAIKARQPDVAAKALSDARNLAPTDPALPGLQQQIDQLRAQMATDTDKAKREAAYKQAFALGQKYLTERKYDQAIQALGEALKQVPNDPGATTLLQQAQKARTDEGNNAKIKASFDQAVLSGQKAMVAKQFDVALKAFGDALKIIPGEATATALFQQAQRALSDAQAEEARRARFSQLMKQGQDNLAAKKYKEAAGAYSEALKITPNDPAALRGLQDANQGLKGPPPLTPQQIQAEFTRLMQIGSALEKQKKWSEALKNYQDAVKLVPTDAKAKEAVRQTDFSLHMEEGNKHLAARRFPEATAEFEAALRLVPDSMAAQAALKKARAKMP